MSNQIYETGYYHENIKKRFLHSIDPEGNTPGYRNYSAVLSRAKGLEEALSKDLYNFNLHEIEQLMKYFNCTTKVSAHNRLNNIQNYISWAIRQGYTDSNINPLDGIVSDEYCKKIVGDVTKVFITDQEMFGIIHRLVNFQDQALIFALFEGIAGKELSELANLKREDIDLENRSIRLRGIDGDRELFLEDDRLIRVLIKASEEQVYKINNGERTETSKNRRTRGGGSIEIFESTYVIKHLKNEKATQTPVQRHTLSRRLADIKRYMQGEIDFLNPINIRNSGMLRSARDIYWTTGKFEDDDGLQICKRYNVSTEGQYAWHHLKRNFLNLNTIIQMYGDKPRNRHAK